MSAMLGGGMLAQNEGSDHLLDLLHPVAGLAAVGVMLGAVLIVMTLWFLAELCDRTQSDRLECFDFFGGPEWPCILKYVAFLIAPALGLVVGAILGIVIDPLALFVGVPVMVGATLMSLLFAFMERRQYVSLPADWRSAVAGVIFPIGPVLGLLAGLLVHVLVSAVG